MEYTLSTFTAQSGFTSAKAVADDETTRHIHSLVKPEDEGRFFRELTLWGDVLIFLGTGLGYHVRDKVVHLPSNVQLVVAVEYFDALSDHFVMHFPPAVQQQIIRISSQNSKQIDTLLSNISEILKTSKIQVVTHPASFSLYPEFYNETLNRLFPAVQPQQSPSRSKIKSGATVCIMNGGHFLEQEMSHAFSQCDTTAVHTINYSADELRASYESRLQRMLQKLKPDILLSVNMKGIDTNGALQEYTWRLGIPVVVWFVDDPHPILVSYGTRVRSHMIACSWEKRFLPYLDSCGFSSAHYLPLAADSRRYTKYKRKTQQIPISFVGSAIYGDYLCKIRNNFHWTDTLEPIVRECARLLHHERNLEISEALAKSQHTLSRQLPFNDKKNITWLCSYILHYASMSRRKKYVEKCMAFGIEVFGDPVQWNALVGEMLVTHPAVDYHTQVDKVYRNSKINLNVTNYQMKSGCNQRVFDVPLCGGFILNDAQQDLFTLFDTSHPTIVTYSNAEELDEKVNWYLSHLDERESIITQTQKHILANHCYENRADDIITLAR